MLVKNMLKNRVRSLKNEHSTRTNEKLFNVIFFFAFFSVQKYHVPDIILSDANNVVYESIKWVA